MNQSYVHITGDSGHRAEYQALFMLIFGFEPSQGPISGAVRRQLINANQLLFATIDDDLRGYFFVALFRSFSGRKTVGVYLRPQSCLAKGLKPFIKVTLFRLLRCLPKITTLSSIPFDLLDGQQKIVSGWLHDPQLWDIVDASEHPDPTTTDTVRTLSEGRKVLAFLGHISTVKGFSLLAAMIMHRPSLAQQYCIIVAGPLESECREQVNQLTQFGVTVWPRRLEEAEMAAIYAEADLIWACYNPSYDQASGIFGRAIQRHRMVVVRQGATITKYADILGHPYIALPYDPIMAAEKLAGANIVSVDRTEILEDWRMQSIAKIRSAL